MKLSIKVIILVLDNLEKISLRLSTGCPQKPLFLLPDQTKTSTYGGCGQLDNLDNLKLIKDLNIIKKIVFKAEGCPGCPKCLRLSMTKTVNND